MRGRWTPGRGFDLLSLSRMSVRAVQRWEEVTHAERSLDFEILQLAPVLLVLGFEFCVEVEFENARLFDLKSVRLLRLREMVSAGDGKRGERAEQTFVSRPRTTLISPALFLTSVSTTSTFLCAAWRDSCSCSTNQLHLPAQERTNRHPQLLSPPAVPRAPSSRRPLVQKYQLRPPVRAPSPWDSRPLADPSLLPSA